MEQQEEKKASYPEEGVTEEVTQAPAYDDESSFCNCENQECITPYEMGRPILDSHLPEKDDRNTEDERDADDIERPHEKTPTKPQGMGRRLKADFLAADCNPYIKRDHTCRIDLYQKKGDTEPIDRFESNCSHSFSVRAMLLAGASLLGVWIISRMLRKEQ